MRNPSKIFLCQMKIKAHAMIHSTMNNVLCDENNATNTSSDVTGLIIFFDFSFYDHIYCPVPWVMVGQLGFKGNSENGRVKERQYDYTNFPTKMYGSIWSITL